MKIETLDYSKSLVLAQRMSAQNVSALLVHLKYCFDICLTINFYSEQIEANMKKLDDLTFLDNSKKVSST